MGAKHNIATQSKKIGLCFWLELNGQYVFKRFNLEKCQKLHVFSANLS